MLKRRIYRLGSRASRLALWQANHIRERLLAEGAFRDIEIVHVKTRGDVDRTTPITRLGGKGVFVKEIEERLLSGDIDLAVHSMKDMSAWISPRLMIAACVGGASRYDCLLSGGNFTMNELLPGARIGTGSSRRGMQLLLLHPDIRVVEIRGNVPTRVAKMDRGEVDGLILARAGLERLGLDRRIAQDFGPEEMVPAAGQGVIVVEARREDADLIEALRSINDEELEALAGIEFSFTRELGAGCRKPVGVIARRGGEAVKLFYFVGKEASNNWLSGIFEGEWEERAGIGKALAEKVRMDWRDRFGEEF